MHQQNSRQGIPSSLLFPAIFQTVSVDFNIPFDRILNSCTSSTHTSTSTALQQGLYTQALSMLGDQPTQHSRNLPDQGAVIASPTASCLPIFLHHPVPIKHDLTTQYYLVDHFPVFFRLQHASYPACSRLPWNFPTWLLKFPLVQEALKTPLLDLTNRVRFVEEDNPGALFYEHTRSELGINSEPLKLTSSTNLPVSAVSTRLPLNLPLR